MSEKNDRKQQQTEEALIANIFNNFVKPKLPSKEDTRGYAFSIQNGNCSFTGSTHILGNRVNASFCFGTYDRYSPNKKEYGCEELANNSPSSFLLINSSKESFEKYRSEFVLRDAQEEFLQTLTDFSKNLNMQMKVEVKEKPPGIL